MINKKAFFMFIAAVVFLSTAVAPAFSQSDESASGISKIRQQLKDSAPVSAPAGQVKAPAAAASPAAAKKIGAITGQGVYVRKEATTSSPAIHNLLYGSRFEFIEEKNGFVKAKFEDGVTGWVAKQFVTYTNKELIDDPAYSEEAMTASYETFKKTYADYTKKRDKATYDAFKKAYSTYRKLAKQSPDYKKLQSNTALTKIVVDKNTYTLTVYLNDKPVRAFPIAYGSNPDGKTKQKVGDCRTPDGDFKILYKEVRPYEGVATRGMWLDSRWGDIGLHGTPNPDSIGSKASHGCVRMFCSDSIELYKLLRVGTPVSIKAYKPSAS